MPLWSNLVQIFEKGGKDRTPLVDGQKAKDLMRTVDVVLDKAFEVLAGMKRGVSVEEYRALEIKHHRLFVMAVEVKSEARLKEEEDPDYFSDPNEQANLHSRLQKILRQCQTFHSDVVSASRQIQDIDDTGLEMGNEVAPMGPSLAENGTGSGAPWLSVVAGTGSPSVQGGNSESQPGPKPNGSPPAQPFVATIAHVPQNSLAIEEAFATQCEDENAYYRVLICGNKYKRVVVLDPNPHNAGHEDAESSQDEILQVGDMMMRSDAQSLAVHPVVDNYQGPSFITSFISTLSLGVSAPPLGGMV